MILMPTDKKFSSTVSLIFKSYRININFHILKYIKSYSSSFKKVFHFFHQENTHTMLWDSFFLKIWFLLLFQEASLRKILKIPSFLACLWKVEDFRMKWVQERAFMPKLDFFRVPEVVSREFTKKKLNTFENCFGRATTGDWKQWSRVKSLQDWNETIWVCSVFYVFFTVCSRIEQSWRFFFSLV